MLVSILWSGLRRIKDPQKNFQATENRSSIALNDSATFIRDIAEITSTGATGDSIKATREKGEKMPRCVTDYLVGLVEDLERREWRYDLKK